MKPLLFFCCICFSFSAVHAQVQPDRIYKDDIRGVAFFRQGDPYSFPLLEFGASDLLELHFDEMGRQPRNYFYTFQLCNADWSPADLNVFEYLRGFTQNRILQYRMSSAEPQHQRDPPALRTIVPVPTLPDGTPLLLQPSALRARRLLAKP